MRDWPDPDEESSSNLLVQIEFWVLVGLSILTLVASFGPTLVGFLGF